MPSTVVSTTSPIMSTSVASSSGQVAKPRQLPFKVANSIPPVPAKLVKRIQALEFVDMRELLPDNIALAERLAILPTGLASQRPPGLQEIGGERALLTWVSSFATYVAILAGSHPGRVADMLAYMRLIVREASKFGGMGWLTYDAVFRRNQEGSSAPWNYLDASLHQVYIANQRERVTAPCQHCQEIDHSTAECAVASILAKPVNRGTDHRGSAGPERPSRKGKRPSPYTRQRPVCGSWNAGNCSFPGTCVFAHVCSNCYGPHQASSCRERPQTSSGGPRQPPATSR